MTCDEFRVLVKEKSPLDVPRAVRSAFLEHKDRCEDCVEFLDRLASGQSEVPQELKEALLTTIIGDEQDPEHFWRREKT